jgi:hypothetical protein
MVRQAISPRMSEYQKLQKAKWTKGGLNGTQADTLRRKRREKRVRNQ